MYLSGSIFEYLKTRIELIFGWVEIALKQGNDYKYKYIMERIELKEIHEKIVSIVYYKLVGCRKLHSESAIELNKSAIFTLFRPDHAQMIVSIATAEILIGTPVDEIKEKYKRYVSRCNLELDGNK